MSQPESGVRVRVQPKASRNEILGFQGDVLRIRVTAPPDRGKANEALVELLASTLGVARSKVRVLKGHGSRNKMVAIGGLSTSDLQRHLKDPDEF